MEFTVQQIATLVKGEVSGDATLPIRMAAKIEEAREGDIAFLANMKYESFLYTTQASAVLVNRDFAPKSSHTCTLILVDDAYSAFATLLIHYEKLIKFSKVGVEQPCYIAESSVIGEGHFRGAFSYIGERVVIGNNVKIYPNAYIGNNVKIGNNCLIYSGVRIMDGCVIGNDCTFHPNAVVGGDGFGFAPQTDGSYRTIPQLGNVVIEDQVSIGANTTIDRATTGSTLIGRGVKLDNLVQIAHNVVIGENTVIAAQTGVAGTAKIGANCRIGGQVGISGHIEVPDNTQISGRAGVTRTFRKKEKDLVLGGMPATDNREFMKQQALIRRLPELTEKIKQIEKNIVNLPLQKEE